MSKHITYIPGVDIDRRKGPDALSRFINGMAIMAWIVIFFSTLVLDQAQPKLLTSQTEWNHKLLGILYYLFLIAFAFSLIGLMLNRKRKRRKGDMYRFSLVISFCISAVGLLLLMF